MVPAAAEAAPIPASAVVPAAPIPVIPRAGADEHAIKKPIWAIVAVRRTSIRVIIVVAVRAYWRRAIVVTRADANADHHSLCMRERRAKEANHE
jgi:hypothetical protein